MVTPKQKNSTDKLTVAALKYYVPIFQMAEEAEKMLLQHGPELTAHERNHYETTMKLKELTVQKISSLAAPLITREINKIMATSHLRGQEDLFNVLYYAGIDGMKRGLRKFEVDKMNASSTNYLFQWITTYAKKELVVLEAPFGIPPSRFQRYKKISAVRKRLTEQLNRYATNEEVLEYFASGKADIQTMNGRVADKYKPSQANKNIDLTIIEEQERFEKEMLTVNLLDPLDDYSGEVRMSEHAETLFSETIFGVFCNSYNITLKARVVMMSDLGVRRFSSEEEKMLDSIPATEYRSLANQWKNLIRDVHGPFYQFLLDHKNAEFAQFDVKGTLKSMENFNKTINSDLYAVLFEGEKVVKL